MADIHIQRIKSALHKLFDGRIDMADYFGKSDHDSEMAFLSRALAAYALMMRCDVDEGTAAASITDGFNDCGVDLIYFDEENSILYVAQSKWIDNGNGSLAQGECLKLVSGCKDLVNMRLSQFNQKVQLRSNDLRSAVESTDVQIVLLLAHSGVQSLSSHVNDAIGIFLTEMNDTSEVFSVEHLNQASFYSGIASHAQRHTIDLTILLHQWGYISHPYAAYYGQVDVSTITAWWKEHGRGLFTRNIRNFKGSTEINNSIISTLKEEPEHFWYFNNGITILCASVNKQLLGGPSRDSGVFECRGVNIVNGAQTVGVIGTSADSLTEPLEQARVLVRVISLEQCPEGFDKSVTRATNTQNRIENRDFAALDPNQRRLASEFLLDGRQYAYKSGDAEPASDRGCTIVDATVALACARDISLAVQAKREIGKLWEDIDSEPYTLLFNDKTNSVDVWKAVEIMRAVESRLKELGDSSEDRADLVSVHGNRFILHRVFCDKEIRKFRASDADIAKLKDQAKLATDVIFASVLQYLNASFQGAYLASFFKNLNRCRDLNVQLEKEQVATSSTPQQSTADGSGERQTFMFTDEAK